MAVMAVEAVPMAASAVGGAGAASAGAASGGAAAGGIARGGASKAASSKAAPKAGPTLNETLGGASLGGGEKKSPAKKGSSKSESGKTKTTSVTPTSSKTKKSTGFKIVSKVGNRKSLLAELVICLVVLLLGSLVRDNEDGRSSIVRLMVKGSALLGVFFVLSILSTGGDGAQKASGAIGLLVTMTYMLTSEDINNILKWIKSFFKPGVEKAKGEDDKKDQTSDTDTGEPPSNDKPPTAEV